MKILKGVRKFSMQPLNWIASDWTEIIDWDTVKVFEPSILVKLESEQLENSKFEPVAFPKFPLHSQSDERSVKKATTKVVGEAKRHQHILSVVCARKGESLVMQKKDFVYDPIS